MSEQCVTCGRRGSYPEWPMLGSCRTCRRSGAIVLPRLRGDYVIVRHVLDTRPIGEPLPTLTEARSEAKRLQAAS